MHIQKCSLPPTAKRVANHTCPVDNARIRLNTLDRLEASKYNNEELLNEKIRKLDYEWDTERVLETNAAAIVVLSTFLGLTVNKLWLLLSGSVGLFLLQHALQGWCPPVPVIRKNGIRTAEEINQEKIVLKMLRGDFALEKDTIEEMLSAAEK